MLEIEQQAVSRLKVVSTTVVALLVMAGLVGVFAYYQLYLMPEKIKAELAARPTSVLTVSTEIATTESWQPFLTAVATLEAANGVDVAAEVDGLITGILFQSGQLAEAGDPLIQLDDHVLRAELKEVQAQFRNAEAELERIRRLERQNMTSKSDLDAMHSRRDEAAAAVERVQATIAQKSVKAPFSGRLGVRLVQLGQYVEASTPMVTLQHAQPIYANFSLPEQALAQIKVGDVVDLEVDSYPGEIFPGRVTSFDSKVDPRTRTFLVQTTLPNVDLRLVPGQYANARISTGDPREQVSVPEAAILFRLYGDSVYMVGSPNKTGQRIVEQRIVKLGAIRDGRAVVLEGIDAGEEIVSIGAFKLRNGAAIEINNSIELAEPGLRPKH